MTTTSVLFPNPNYTGSTTSGTSSSTSSSDSGSASSLDATTLGGTNFLTLMLAQLKNQDPTSPVDSNTFLSQLASLSTVQGITQLNTSFGSLSSSLVSSQALFVRSPPPQPTVSRQLPFSRATVRRCSKSSRFLSSNPIPAHEAYWR